MNDDNVFANANADIDTALYSWWQNNEDLGKDLAEEIVSWSLADTFVDEVILENNAVIVRALSFTDIADDAAMVEAVVIARLRKVFGCKARLELTEVTQRFGDDV